MRRFHALQNVVKLFFAGALLLLEIFYKRLEIGMSKTYLASKGFNWNNILLFKLIFDI